MMALTILSCMWTVALVMVQSRYVSSHVVYNYLEGDFTVVGLFDLKRGANCDESNTDAKITLDGIEWYLRKLNTNGDLPFRLGLKGYDTCGPPGTEVRIALDVIYEHKFRKDMDSKLIGIISMLSNEDTLSLATVLKSMPREYQFLHISITATSTELGNGTNFPNFFRVIPDDRKRMTTLIKLLKSLEWNRIGIIHEDQPNLAPFVSMFDTVARHSRICISKTTRIQTNKFGEVIIQQLDEALDDVLKSSIPIEGVVFIGSEKVARNVLERSDRHSQLANLPRFILTGSIGLDTDTFQSVSNDGVLTKTLGSLVIVPAFTEITSYLDYRKTLHTHSKELGKELLHVKYGIIAAHAIAKVTKQVFLGRCNRKEGTCVGNIQPSTMINSMNVVTLDMHSDFNTSMDPRTMSKYKLQYSNSTDPDYISDQDVYQLYLFRQDTTNQPELYKVGFLSGKDDLTLNETEINYYREDGTADSRKGQCPANKRCPECLEKDIPEHKIHIPGNIYIIGIAPVYNKGEGNSGCKDIYPEGYELARALQYGLEVFNTNETYEKYKSKFGGNKIGMVILNSCTNDLVIVRKILELNKYGLQDDEATRSINITGNVLGYIGAFTSDVTLRVADTLTEMNQVQISYSSTTPKLSNAYPHFLRVVPSDELQVQAILNILQELKTEFVQVLYAEKDYGEAALEILRREAHEHNICIKQSKKVEKDDNYFRYSDFIEKEPNAKVVILFLHHQFLEPLMKELNTKLTPGDFHFIASDGWGRHKDLLDNDIAFGTITVAIEMQEVEGLVPFIQSQEISADHHIWREQYLQDHQKCFYDWSYDKTNPKRCPDPTESPNIDFPRDDWANFATLSVLALLKGAAEFYGDHCPSRTGLCQDFTREVDSLVEKIKDVSMDTTGQGSTRVFDQSGNGNIGYTIYSIQRNESDGNKLSYVKIGKYDRGELEIDKRKLTVIPESICPNEKACKQENCEGSSDMMGQCKASQSVQDAITWEVILASSGGIIGVILALVILVCSIIRLKKMNMSGSETPGTQYITPLEMTVETNNAADSYHDILIHEETRY